ncbi:esterase family protein [Gulosibacter chungangensis]|uniref:Esterase family protein n=2 Tax=Gulosibacter chungangensis TaxID=979746 RepID=A0A7J5BBZ6_9MICO|nr:esterase family protein [Gulosibacter chungangensis]
MGLPRILDQAVEVGVLPPVHLALLDVGDPRDRGEQLGVPGGQVDVLLDELLPQIRAQWNVTREGSDTIVAGQSLGGIAALWTLALSDGEVGRAIAQSPSLWRFDVAEPLLSAAGWTSIQLQAGVHEGHMIDATHNLEQTLDSDLRLQGRKVRRTVFTGGHDWPAWRAELVTALAEVLPVSA